MRIPRSNPEIGYIGPARSNPNIVNTGQYIGSVLGSLGESIGRAAEKQVQLDKYNKAESEREDALLLTSGNWQGELKAIAENTFDPRVYDENGDVNYEQSIMKATSILGSHSDLISKVEEDAIGVTNRLNLQSDKVNNIALAGVSEMVSSLRLNQEKSIRGLEAFVDSAYTINASNKIADAVIEIQEGNSAGAALLASAIGEANQLIETGTVTNPESKGNLLKIINEGRSSWMSSYPSTPEGSEQKLTDYNNGLFNNDPVMKELFITNEFSKSLQSLITGISLGKSGTGITTNVGSATSPIYSLLTSNVGPMLESLIKTETDPNILRQLKSTQAAIQSRTVKNIRLNRLISYSLSNPEDPNYTTLMNGLLSEVGNKKKPYKSGDVEALDNYLGSIGQYKKDESELYAAWNVIEKLDPGILPKNIEGALKVFMLKETHKTHTGNVLFLDMAEKLGKYDLDLEDKEIDRILVIANRYKTGTYDTFEETTKEARVPTHDVTGDPFLARYEIDWGLDSTVGVQLKESYLSNLPEGVEGTLPEGDKTFYNEILNMVARSVFSDSSEKLDTGGTGLTADQIVELTDSAREYAKNAADRLFVIDTAKVTGRDETLSGTGKNRLFYVPMLSKVTVTDPNGRELSARNHIPNAIYDAISGADPVEGMENLTKEENEEYLYSVVKLQLQEDNMSWKLMLPNGTEVVKSVEDRNTGRLSKYAVVIDFRTIKDWSLNDQHIIKDKEVEGAVVGTPVDMLNEKWNPSFMLNAEFQSKSSEEQIETINKYLRNFQKPEDYADGPWAPEAFKSIEDYPGFAGLDMEEITKHIVANFRDKMNTDPFITGKVTSPIFLKHIRSTARELIGTSPGRNLQQIWNNDIHIPKALASAQREFLETVGDLSQPEKKAFINNIRSENAQFDMTDILNGDGTSGSLIRRELFRVQSGIEYDKDVTMGQIGEVAKGYVRTIEERKGRDLQATILWNGWTAPGNENSPILELLGGTITNPGHYNNASIISRAIQPLDGSSAYPWVPLRELYKSNGYKKISKSDLITSMSLMSEEESPTKFTHYDFLRANASSLFTHEDQNLIFGMDDNRFSGFVWELIGKEVIPITVVDWPTNGR